MWYSCFKQVSLCSISFFSPLRRNDDDDDDSDSQSEEKSALIWGLSTSSSNLAKQLLPESQLRLTNSESILTYTPSPPLIFNGDTSSTSHLRVHGESSTSNSCGVDKSSAEEDMSSNETEEVSEVTRIMIVTPNDTLSLNNFLHHCYDWLHAFFIEHARCTPTPTYTYTHSHTHIHYSIRPNKSNWSH